MIVTFLMGTKKLYDFYGIANLKGKTLRERARKLINIAHPDFRPQLIEEWEKRFKTKF